MNFEAVIGLEIHIELKCASKMFCSCPNDPSAPPNKNICPVCLWHPGVLPKFNKDVLDKAVFLCLGLNCDIQKMSAFDQKVYYYPDLPKGYQLSQAHFPLAKNGGVDVVKKDGSVKNIRIRHIHLEEDVARLVHETEGKNPIGLVDFNRAGVPLVEIVTQPDIRGAEEAMEFVKNLRNQIRYTGSAECSMESGAMRVDANISLREKGTDILNTKVEVKNMNSVRAVGDAVNYEIKRQAERYEKGEKVTLHTRLWNPDKSVTVAMRAKFEGPCVPDPNTTKIMIDDKTLEKMKAALPEMPQARIKRLQKEYGLEAADAQRLCSEIETARYFEDAARANPSVPSKTAAGWILTQLISAVKEKGGSLAESPVTPARFMELLDLMEKNEITAASAKKVLGELFSSKFSPAEIIDKKGLRQLSDENSLKELAADALNKNPSAVADYKAGKNQSFGFLMGQVMRASRGKADPQLLQKILKDLLS